MLTSLLEGWKQAVIEFDEIEYDSKIPCHSRPKQ